MQNHLTTSVLTIVKQVVSKSQLSIPVINSSCLCTALSTRTMLEYCQLVCLVIISLVSCQDDYVSECPEDNGFFADALQCDRYYECRDGEVG